MGGWGLGGVRGLGALGVADAAAERLGEAFTYSLKLGSIEGGRARLAIAPPHRVGQRLLMSVVGEVEGVGLARALLRLRIDYRATLDAELLLPLTVERSEASTLRDRTIKTDLSGRRAEIQLTQRAETSRLSRELPFEPRDPVAAFLALRAAALRDGDHLELVIMDSTDFYRGTVDVVGREPLATEQGPRRAIRLKCRGEKIADGGPDAGQARSGRFGRSGRSGRMATLWLSDDTYRVPLLIEGETDFGTARFELTSYQPPRRPMLPSAPSPLSSPPSSAASEGASSAPAGPLPGRLPGLIVRPISPSQPQSTQEKTPAH